VNGYLYAYICVEHAFHYRFSLESCAGWFLFSIKSSVNWSRLFTNGAQGSSLGKSMTIVPNFLINTSSPENRNSLGSLTAWLLPFVNILAVCIWTSLPLISDRYRGLYREEGIVKFNHGPKLKAEPGNEHRRLISSGFHGCGSKAFVGAKNIHYWNGAGYCDHFRTILILLRNRHDLGCAWECISLSGP